MALVKTNGRTRRANLLPRTPLLGSSLLGSTLLDDFLLPDWGINMFDEGYPTSWVPAANVREHEKDFTVELSVPGYAKKDISVEVDDNNVLHISGERKEESKEESEFYTRREFSHGSFTRSFQLPENIISEKVSAKCTDGVLSVDLPKKEATILKAKAKQIKVA